MNIKLLGKLRIVILLYFFMFNTSGFAFSDESVLSPDVNLNKDFLDHALKSKELADYIKEAREYQSQLNQNFVHKDEQTRQKLELPEEDIASLLKGNEIAFIPQEENIYERSIFISVDVGHSKKLRQYADEVQKKIVIILGSKSKIRLNSLAKLHFTLINNEIGGNVGISNEAIITSHQAYKLAVEEMGSFDISVCGPHMMSNFGIVLEVRTDSPEILLFRRKAQQILEQQIKEKGVKGFVPDIIHISLGYIVNATKQELVDVYDALSEFRHKNEPISLTANKVQTVKTINKSMYDDGAVTYILPISHLNIIMQSI